MVKYKISEIFMSIQGEGILQGMPSIFIRFVGCNLKCAWCDTKTLINREWKLFNQEEIFDYIKQYDADHIVLTGGEPLIQKDMDILTKYLKNKGYHITIETNATIIKNISCDLVSMSPKLSNSITQNRTSVINLKVIRYYIQNYHYQIKFVVQEEKDFREIQDILSKLDSYDEEYVQCSAMSESKEDLEMVQKNIIRLCIKYHLRYCNRLQLQVWNNAAEI